jgi:probable rRNA maturation factor
MAVCLVSDQRMRTLNREYRGRDATTDVLAFPVGGDPPRVGADECYLGDVVISVQRAAEQAKRAGHSFARELKILAVHGYLHLLGFDHEKDAGRMMRLQGRLLRIPPSRPRGAGR